VESAQNFAVFRIKQYDYFVDYLQLLSASCLGQYDDEACQNNIELNKAKISDINASINENSVGADAILAGVESALEMNCFTMGQRIYEYDAK
jgi:hypothetical protein